MMCLLFLLASTLRSVTWDEPRLAKYVPLSEPVIQAE